MIRTLRLLFSVSARSARATLRERGWAQRTVIILFLMIAAALFVGFFLFFSRAFGFIGSEPFAGPVIARYVLESALHVMFLLGAASFVSVAASFMFTSDEVRMLSSLPVSPATLFTYRLTSATIFASWPIVLVGVPAIVAFGNALGAGAAYYVGAVVVLALFLAAIAVVGSLVAFLLSPLLGLFRQTTRVILQAGAFVLFAIILVRTTIPHGIFGTFFFVTSPAAARDRIATIRRWFGFAPSRPFADLLASILPYGCDVRVAAEFAGTAVVVASLFLLLYAVVLKWYQRTVQMRGETGFLARPEDVGPVHPRHAFPAIFRWRHGYLFEKDLLSFFRDPAEVSRGAFLATLLFLYVVAARGVMALEIFKEPGIPVEAIVFAFGAIGYFALAFSIRFVFPSLSREGRSAWVLWSSPVHVHEFFSWKLFFWTVMVATGTTAASLLTVLLFGMPVVIGLFFTYTALCASIGLVVIALGQGAIYPDFSQPDPDVLSTSPAGLATTGLGIVYLLIVGRYLYGFTDAYLHAGQRVELLDGFGILIVTVFFLVTYWILAPRSMDRREIA